MVAFSLTTFPVWRLGGNWKSLAWWYLVMYDVCARYTVEVEDTPGRIRTTQSESLRSTITLRILSSFHSSYWIETVTVPSKT